ncbi:MAG: PEP-CTERM sorting domain-containing protein [Geobacter sp.]|nr:PEP-CTERM sorting domain-containing protein [Geobacter sp.]
MTPWKTMFATCMTVAVLATQAHALTSTIQDQFYGSYDHGYGDVLAASTNVNAFQVSSLQVVTTGSKLQISVNGSYFNPTSGNKYGTTMGDLFISTNGWRPDTSKANYLNDGWKQQNGTWIRNDGEMWEYAFVFDSDAARSLPTGSGQVTSGTFSVYALPTATVAAAAAATRFSGMPSGYIWRDGQEWAVNKNGAGVTREGALGAGTWTRTDQALTFDLADFSEYFTTEDLNSPNGWGYHWAMSCGNDTIEGMAPTPPPVPEPSTLVLLGVGLLGVGVFRFKRRG